MRLSQKPKVLHLVILSRASSESDELSKDL